MSKQYQDQAVYFQITAAGEAAIAELNIARNEAGALEAVQQPVYALLDMVAEWLSIEQIKDEVEENQKFYQYAAFDAAYSKLLELGEQYNYESNFASSTPAHYTYINGQPYICVRYQNGNNVTYTLFNHLFIPQKSLEINHDNECASIGDHPACYWEVNLCTDEEIAMTIEANL